jgi:serine/threonine-protein kinase RsbT
MNDLIAGEVAIDTEYDIVTARKAVRQAAVDFGFGVTDVTRIVTAASELSRNIFLYAKSGTVSWSVLPGEPAGLEIAFVDHGPGIDDLDQCMEPGYTSGKGMGMGLPGAKRLMDDMEVISSPGEGTTVIIRKWLRV